MSSSHATKFIGRVDCTMLYFCHINPIILSTWISTWESLRGASVLPCSTAFSSSKLGQFNFSTV